MPTSSGHTSVILGSKVIGTPVYAAGGEKVGHMQDLLLDKLSGELVLAVIGVGFSAGHEQRCCPVPWGLLDYTPGRDGYVLGLTEAQLRSAPSFDLEELTKDDGARVRDLTNTFFNAI